ncbi:hypothetical protein BGZ73_007646 [Actinomortierella ambigua]|nr:hypothetical protein BGZ73_007646 [Actinomortierella ambigua]
MLVGHIPTIKDFIQQKCEPLVQDLSRSIEPNLSSVIAHLLCAQRSRSRNCLTILQETTAFLANTNALVMDIPLDLVIPMLNGKYSEQLLYLQSHNPFSTFSCTNTFGNSGDNDTALSTHDLGDAVHPSIVSISKLCELWDEALEYSRLTAASFDFQADDYLAMASVLSGLRDKWEIEGGMLDCSPTHSGSRRGCKGDDGGDEETAVDRILRILNRRARECKVALHRKQIDPGDGRQKQTEPHQQPLEALRLQAQVRKHLQQQHHHQHQQQPQDEQRQDLRPSWAHNSSLPRQRHSVAPHSPVDDDAVAVSTAGSMTTGFHGEAVEEDDGDERDEADEMLLDHADRDAVIVKTEEEDGPTSLSATLCMRKDQFYQTKRKCPLGGMPTYNTSSGNGGADTNGSTAMYEHEQMVESPHDVNDIRYGEEFNRAAAFVSTNLSRKRRYELSEEENAVFAEDEDEEDEDEDEVSVVRLVGDSSTSLTDSRTMAAVFGRMLVNNTHPDQEKSQTASFPAIPESEASNSERSKQHSKSVGSTGPSMLTEPHSLRSSGLQHSFRTTVTNHHPPVTALLLPTQTVRTAPKKKRGMNTTDGHHDENAHRMDQRPATSDSARDQHAEARLAEALSVSDSHHTNEEHIGEMGAQTATTTIEEPSHTASVMKDPQQRRRGLRQRNTLADKQPSRKRDSRSALEQLARRKGVKYEVRQLLTDQLKNFYVPPDLCRHHRIRNSSRRRGVVMSHPTRRLPAPPTSLQMKARPSRSRKSVAP